MVINGSAVAALPPAQSKQPECTTTDQAFERVLARFDSNIIGIGETETKLKAEEERLRNLRYSLAAARMDLTATQYKILACSMIENGAKKMDLPTAEKQLDQTLLRLKELQSH